jgi:4-diphosphocytidyl-2-C-methyl-D-erythritol kinase
MIHIAAPAKVNLVLEVLGKREDDYHEIRSLMQTIDLCDDLYFEANTDIRLECNVDTLQTPDNIVLKAAELLKNTYNYEHGAKIRLEKVIPSSAGLGGGSSDAAMTLLALNRLWRLRLKRENLLQLAARLGSDVPFFLEWGMALVKGRGEIVVPLPSTPIPWFVILVPPLEEMPEKTKSAYSRLKKNNFTEGQYMSEVMQSWSIDYRIHPKKLFNVFDEIAFEAFPQLEEYRRKFEEAGAGNIHLAGSGPSLFAPFDDQMQAADTGRRLTEAGLSSFVVSALTT